ncbi:hypothetical protein, variant [Salpingoeca rosetta]|nr:hypothetical protein, variant [Salpingoeca rosetta]EGD83154.1 hypothetical protein, variant [Salpingoeca rosetta]|eukprot:XP_004995518.1 hypothetical protein, variant [Salpingoeca rosetta]
MMTSADGASRAPVAAAAAESAQDAWAEVNECLASHGYRPVRLVAAASPEVEGLTVLREDSAASLRQMILQIIADNDRRASVVRRLSSEITRAKQAKHSSAEKVRAIGAQLEAVNETLEAEREAVQREADMRKAEQEHAASTQYKLEARITQLQGKLKFTQAQNDRLQHDVERLSQQVRDAQAADTARRQRLDQVYSDLQQQRVLGGSSGTPADRHVLQVVEMYEAKMEALLQELEALRPPSSLSLSLRGSGGTPSQSPTRSGGGGSSGSNGDGDSQASSSHVEHLEKVLAEERAHVSSLQMQLKAKELEMSALPTQTGWREAQERIATLEDDLAHMRRHLQQQPSSTAGGGQQHGTSSALDALVRGDLFPPSQSADHHQQHQQHQQQSTHGAEYYKFHLYKLRSMGKDKLRGVLSDVCRLMNVSPEEIVPTLSKWSALVFQAGAMHSVLRQLQSTAAALLHQQRQQHDGPVGHDNGDAHLGAGDRLSAARDADMFLVLRGGGGGDALSPTIDPLSSTTTTAALGGHTGDAPSSSSPSSPPPLPVSQALDVVCRVAMKANDYKHKLASTSHALKLIAGGVYPVFGRQLDANDSIDDLVERVMVLCDNHTQLQRRLDMHEAAGRSAASPRRDSERVLQHAQMLFGVTEPSALIPVWSHIRGRLNASRQALASICDVLNVPQRSMSPDRVAHSTATIISNLKQEVMSNKRRLEDVALALDCKPSEIYPCVHSVMARLRQYDAVLPILRNWIDTVLSLCGVNTLEQAIQYLTKITDANGPATPEKPPRTSSSAASTPEQQQQQQQTGAGEKVVSPSQSQLRNEPSSALLGRLDATARGGALGGGGGGDSSPQTSPPAAHGSPHAPPISRRRAPGSHYATSPPSSVEELLDDLAQFDLEASFVSSSQQDRPEDDNFVLEACEHFLSSPDVSSQEDSPPRHDGVRLRGADGGEGADDDDGTTMDEAGGEFGEDDDDVNATLQPQSLSDDSNAQSADDMASLDHQQLLTPPRGTASSMRSRRRGHGNSQLSVSSSATGASPLHRTPTYSSPTHRHAPSDRRHATPTSQRQRMALAMRGVSNEGSNNGRNDGGGPQPARELRFRRHDHLPGRAGDETDGSSSTITPSRNRRDRFSSSAESTVVEGRVGTDADSQQHDNSGQLSRLLLSQLDDSNGMDGSEVEAQGPGSPASGRGGTGTPFATPTRSATATTSPALTSTTTMTTTTTTTATAGTKRVTFSDDPDDVFCYQRVSSGDDSPPRSPRMVQVSAGGTQSGRPHLESVPEGREESASETGEQVQHYTSSLGPQGEPQHRSHYATSPLSPRAWAQQTMRLPSRDDQRQRVSGDDGTQGILIGTNNSNSNSNSNNSGSNEDQLSADWDSPSGRELTLSDLLLDETASNSSAATATNMPTTTAASHARAGDADDSTDATSALGATMGVRRSPHSAAAPRHTATVPTTARTSASDGASPTPRRTAREALAMTMRLPLSSRFGRHLDESTTSAEGDEAARWRVPPVRRRQTASHRRQLEASQMSATATVTARAGREGSRVARTPDASTARSLQQQQQQQLQGEDGEAFVRRRRRRKADVPTSSIDGRRLNVSTSGGSEGTSSPTLRAATMTAGPCDGANSQMGSSSARSAVSGGSGSSSYHSEQTWGRQQGRRGVMEGDSLRRSMDGRSVNAGGQRARAEAETHEEEGSVSERLRKEEEDHWREMRRLAEAIDDKNFSPSSPPSSRNSSDAEDAAGNAAHGVTNNASGSNA